MGRLKCDKADLPETGQPRASVAGMARARGPPPEESPDETASRHDDADDHPADGDLHQEADNE